MKEQGMVFEEGVQVSRIGEGGGVFGFFFGSVLGKLIFMFVVSVTQLVPVYFLLVWLEPVIRDWLLLVGSAFFPMR